jgi:hypothetical protein
MLMSGGVSRVAKGADCKSAASWLRRFESFLPHHVRTGDTLAPKGGAWPLMRRRRCVAVRHHRVVKVSGVF